MDERRKAVRVPVSLEAGWKSISGRHIAKVSNLSVIGCYLETEGEVLNREVVEVKLKMSDGGWLRLQGQVIYRIPEGGFGVFFIEMDERARQMIGELVESYTTDEDRDEA